MKIYRDMAELQSPVSQYRTPSEEFANAFDHKRESSVISEWGDLIQNQLVFKVKHLEMGMVQRTYDMKVSLK